MDACGAGLRLAGISLWIVYRIRTCRVLFSRVNLEKVKPLFLTEDRGGKKWPFSHQPCKVNFAEHLSVPERM